MKHLFIMLALMCSYKAMAQDNTDISKLLHSYQLPKKTGDTSANKVTLYYIGNMPMLLPKNYPSQSWKERMPMGGMSTFYP